MSRYAWGLPQADAIYHDAHISEQKGNPLIEALPEILSDEELFYNLRQECDVKREELSGLSEEERCSCVDQLYDVFQPWDVHIRIARNLESSIRMGYTGRNPLGAEYIRHQRAVASSVHSRDITFSAVPSNARASGFSIIGFSGMGKTTGITRALKQYPQVISHTEYHGVPFPFTQIIWMKLNCPFDMRVKGLCIEFFQEFDRLTGDNTYERFAASSRATTDLMLPQMAMLASRHGLGALVVDEIQNLRGNGKQQTLDFLTQLVNKIGVPIILVGTQAALETLTSDVATARRFSGANGAVIMDLLEYGSDEWEMLLCGLQKYQWTDKKAALLDKNIQGVLYEESRGMVSHVVNLLVQAQKAAIQRGDDSISSKLISEVAHSDSNLLLRSMLKKIEHNTLSKATDRDFLLALTRIRANKDDTEESQKKEMTADAAQLRIESVKADIAKKENGKKVQMDDLSGYILQKDDPLF